MPPALVNGGLVTTPATRIDSFGSVSCPGDPWVISGAPSAVTVTVKLAGTSESPVSVSDSVMPLVPPEIDWPGWSVTDDSLKLPDTPAGRPSTLRS